MNNQRGRILDSNASCEPHGCLIRGQKVAKLQIGVGKQLEIFAVKVNQLLSDGPPLLFVGFKQGCFAILFKIEAKLPANVIGLRNVSAQSVIPNIMERTILNASIHTLTRFGRMGIW